jgi:uncharacterized membrane protein
MMMDYYNNYQGMMGGYGWGVAPFMWLIYILLVVVLVLAVIALWKYINKK